MFSLDTELGVAKASVSSIPGLNKLTKTAPLCNTMVNHLPTWLGNHLHHHQNALIQAILDRDWKRVQRECCEHSNLAHVWCHDVLDGTCDSHLLPIHLAVASKAPSIDAIQALVHTFPHGLSCKESSYLRLPIHLACLSENTDHTLVQFLVESAPETASVIDRIERLPLHYACANDVAVAELLEIFPEAAMRRDGQGWLPLHIACQYGASLGTIQRLIDLHPDAVMAVTPLDGQTPRDMLRHEHPHDGNAIMDLLVDTENRYTPIPKPTMDILLAGQSRG
jgi:hypothetical protein